MSVLIKNGYVVTVDSQRRVFEKGFVLTRRDGRIAAVGPQHEARCPPRLAGATP